VLLKIKRSLLKGGRDHDKRHFTAGFAKFSCTAKNAELPRGSGLGKLGQASKGNLSPIKDSREKALYDGVLDFRRFRRFRRFRDADDRTSSPTGSYVIAVFVA
jgi:hypothetical protein